MSVQSFSVHTHTGTRVVQKLGGGVLCLPWFVPTISAGFHVSEETLQAPARFARTAVHTEAKKSRGDLVDLGEHATRGHGVAGLVKGLLVGVVEVASHGPTVLQGKLETMSGHADHDGCTCMMHATMSGRTTPASQAHKSVIQQGQEFSRGHGSQVSRGRGTNESTNCIMAKRAECCHRPASPGEPCCRTCQAQWRRAGCRNRQRGSRASGTDSR
jgi:hypothetical protein